MKRWVAATALTATLSTVGLVTTTTGPALAANKPATSNVTNNTSHGCPTYPPRRPTVSLSYTRDGHGGIILIAQVTRGHCVLKNVQVVFKRGNSYVLSKDRTGKYGFATDRSRPLYPATYKYTATYNGVTKTIWVKMPGTRKPHPAP
jgi:hypothetical protein